MIKNLKSFINESSFLISSLVVVGLISLGTGCATLSHTKKTTGATSAKVGSSASPDSESVTLTTEANKTTLAATKHDLYYKDMKIENDKFDLPIEMNPAVEKWIKYFTGKGRKFFVKYLERSEYFIPFLKPILKNAKAPEDLVYLAMIESGFNNTARSHARAVGAWQFITATGRRYGLDVSWWVDERRDIEKSTIAAVQYLKELNEMYGSWPLATASYNAGEAKIQRAIKKYHTTDFWEMCKTKNRYLKPETKNYVPKLYAAAIVAKNRKQFGFEESYTKLKSANGVLVAATDDTDLEKLPDQLDTDTPAAPKVSDAKAADPKITDPKAAAAEAKADAVADAKAAAETKTSEPTIEITKNSPADPEEEQMLAEDSVESMLKSMSNPIRTPHVNKMGEVDGTVLTEIEIPSPADLFKVSSAAGLTYAEFKAMNPELLRWITPPISKTYKIRIPLKQKDEFMKKYFADSFKRDVNFLTYKARKGDTPSRVAKRFGISPDPVAQMNGVSPNSSLMPGAMIELPIPSDFVRSLASLKSLDLIDPAYPKSGRRRRHFKRKNRHADAPSGIHSSQAVTDHSVRSQHI